MVDDYIEIPLIIKKAGTSIHLLRVLICVFLVFMHCTSVSAVLIKSLNFRGLFIFSCNLHGFLLV